MEEGHHHSEPTGSGITFGYLPGELDTDLALTEFFYHMQNMGKNICSVKTLYLVLVFSAKILIYNTLWGWLILHIIRAT